LDGEVVQHVEYVPFGEVFLEEKNAVWNTPYLFNGKELDKETGMSYYGARYYEPKTSVWISVDPLAEKYPNASPYNYCLNNPVNFIDPDGKDILPWIVHHLEKGSLKDINEYGHFTSGLISTMKTILSTNTGKNYLSNFMKKNQNFCGYTADKNGKYSDVNLNIIQYDLQGNDKQFEGAIGAAFYDGVVTVSENNGKLNISVWTFGEDLETITHEFFIHNSGKIDEIIKAYRNGGIKSAEKVLLNGPKADDDHKSLRDLNDSHGGVKNYKNVWNELLKKSKEYEKEYKQIFNTNKQKYKDL
jgi:RHS repeat-associated protein